jgi:hypothetical protein
VPPLRGTGSCPVRLLPGPGVLIVLVLALVAAGAAVLASAVCMVLGGVGGTRALRRELRELRDDQDALADRFEREVKRRASARGVEARSAAEEIRDMVAAGAHLAPAAPAAPAGPPSRAQLVRRARPVPRRPNGAAIETETGGAEE